MTIFLHILKEYLRFVIGIVFLCVFLFILFDFMHKTTHYFAKYQPNGSDIAKFYIYQLPYQVVQALPIASLLGSVVSMVMLGRGNEITVMRAVGMSPFSIAMPLAFGGLLLSLFSLTLSEFVIPVTSKKMRFVQDISIEKHDHNAIAEGVRWVRDKNKLFHFNNFNSNTSTLDRVVLLEVNAAFQLKKSTYAQSANYSHEQGNWVLDQVKVFNFDEKGALKEFKDYEKVTSFLPVDPRKLQKERRLPAEMGIAELNELIEGGERSGKDVLKEKIAWNLKWAYPFASFFVSLMGFRFAFKSERTTESVGKILVAFLIGISYWFIMSAARALGSRGDISPFVAAWSANIAIFCIICFQIIRVRKY